MNTNSNTCEKCSHSEVCGKKEQFKYIQKSVSEINVSMENGTLSLLKHCAWVNADVICKYFEEKIDENL